MKFLLFFGLMFTFFSLRIDAQLDSCVIGNEQYTDYLHVIFMPNTAEFNKQFYTAFKEFPELQDAQIEIKRRHIYTMMAARPGRGFIFQKRDKRRYVILITNHPDMNADSIYTYVGNEAIVGLFGHELSHLMEYRKKSNFKMMCFALSYVFHRKEIEVQTDMMAIQRGFGEDLVKYNKFIHHSHFVNKNYLHKKEKYYLSEIELEKTINDTDLK